MSVRSRIRRLLEKRRRDREPDPRRFLLQLLPKGGVGAEIGVWRGRFAEKLLRATRPRRLHLIDPWLFQEEYPDRLYGGLKVSNQADMDQIYEEVLGRLGVRGDVVIHRDLSSAAAARFRNRYFDWIYIDGNHDYEYVLTDLTSYYPKVKIGGYITGDDYPVQIDGVRTVERAVEEFLRDYAVERVMVKNAQFVLRKEEAAWRGAETQSPPIQGERSPAAVGGPEARGSRGHMREPRMPGAQL